MVGAPCFYYWKTKAQTSRHIWIFIYRKRGKTVTTVLGKEIITAPGTQWVLALTVTGGTITNSEGTQNLEPARAPKPRWLYVASPLSYGLSPPRTQTQFCWGRKWVLASKTSQPLAEYAATPAAYLAQVCWPLSITTCSDAKCLVGGEHGFITCSLETGLGLCSTNKIRKFLIWKGISERVMSHLFI